MAEKLTETLGVKLSDTLLRQAKGVAEANGLGISEWVRTVIETAIEEERSKYRLLADIFGQPDSASKNNLD